MSRGGGHWVRRAKVWADDGAGQDELVGEESADQNLGAGGSQHAACEAQLVWTAAAAGCGGERKGGDVRRDSCAASQHRAKRVERGARKAGQGRAESSGVGVRGQGRHPRLSRPGRFKGERCPPASAPVALPSQPPVPSARSHPPRCVAFIPPLNRRR